jgi:hypothetical protein
MTLSSGIAASSVANGALRVDGARAASRALA